MLGKGSTFFWDSKMFLKVIILIGYARKLMVPGGA